MVDFLMLLLGFAVLTWSAEALVNGAEALSRRFGVSERVIGLTVVAFGTSAPELVVNLSAAARGQGELVLGNVLGSNVFNTTLVLGVGALLCPLVVSSELRRVELPAGIAATLGFLLLANDAWFAGGASLLSRSDGVVLLLAFALFLGRTLWSTAPEPVVEEGPPAGHAAAWTAAGLVGLPLGAWLVVGAASGIAARMGLSEGFIGLTLVSVGTSLPELAATGMAAWRGKGELAVGNVVGSSLFNLLLVLGLSALVEPVPGAAWFTADAGAFLLASGFVLAVAGARGTLDRWTGGVLVGLFAAYLLVLGVREGLVDHQIGPGPLALSTAP